MSDARRPDDDDDILAAEYVVGLLDADERRRVERRARRDAAMQRRIEEWEHRFAPMLAGDAPAAVPPESVWSGIEMQLDRMIRFHSPSAVPAAREGGVSRLWKWFGLGSFGLFAASLAALFVVARPAVAPRPLAAVIAPEGGAAIYAAVIDPKSARATLVPVAAGPGAAYSNQLWLLGENGVPRSLGLLPAEGPAEIAIPPELSAGAGAALAVSREPPGGSPTGQPTGPVIGVGPLRAM